MASTCSGVGTAVILGLDVLTQWERSRKPLFIELTPGLIKEARDYLASTIGYQEVARMTARKAVEMYLGLGE